MIWHEHGSDQGLGLRAPGFVPSGRTDPPEETAAAMPVALSAPVPCQPDFSSCLSDLSPIRSTRKPHAAFALDRGRWRPIKPLRSPAVVTSTRDQPGCATGSRGGETSLLTSPGCPPSPLLASREVRAGGAKLRGNAPARQAQQRVAAWPQRAWRQARASPPRALPSR